MSRRALRAAILHIGLLLVATLAGALDVAAVQFEVSEELYTEPGAFGRRAARMVEDAAAAGAELVVFPEYINVFPLFADDAPVIARVETVSDALAALAADDAAPTETLARLIRERAPTVNRRLRSMWSRLARRNDVAIIAGTGFALADEGGVRNRAYVFDDDGRLVHAQDKVFLTPVELELLGLEPGSIDAVSSFEIEDVELGMTICRDSYFDVFEEYLGDADLWVQVRANGETYTEEVRRRFRGALAERVSETAVAGGVDASLTGRFLDLLWEGPSYAVDGDGRRVASSPGARGSDVVLVRFRADGERATLDASWRSQQ
jgi:predicted amidohydrolase